MKRIIATATAITVAVALSAGAAHAQSWTVTPYGGSIYGGPPDGYVMHYQDNSRDLGDIAEQQLRRFRTTPYGR
jgi:hypothetical protein